MHDLDRDDRDPYPPHWHAARAARPSRHPVIEAYVDTETLDHQCPNCGAQPGDFCHNTDGNPRLMPCNKRITAAKGTP